jgi:hypothetical protein
MWSAQFICAIIRRFTSAVTTWVVVMLINRDRRTLKNSMRQPPPDEQFEQLFTPARIAHLDRVVFQLDAGERTLTLDEVRAGLAKNNAESLKQKNILEDS